MDDHVLFATMKQSQVLAYIWVAGTTVMVYDVLENIDRELTLIWRSKWSVPKVLYLWLRYWVLASMLVNTIYLSAVQNSLERCKIAMVFSDTFGGILFSTFVVDIILAKRLNALYYHKRKVLFFLSTLLIVEFSVAIYAGVRLGQSILETTFLAPPEVPFLGCLSHPNLPGMLPSWIVNIIVSVVFYVMMMSKFCASVTDARQAGVSIEVSPLMHAFVRDGAVYFFVTLLAHTAGILNNYLVKGPLQSASSPWISAVHAIAGSRLILSLREVAQLTFSDDNAESTWQAQSDVLYFRPPTTILSPGLGVDWVSNR